MTRWQVFGAVALRRLPEVMPRRDAILTRVQQIFDAYENSKSRYSQHELQHLEDVRAKELQESDVVLKETAQDLEDKWMKEMSAFKFADHEESLAHTHYLFLRSKFGNDIKEQWLLPQAEFDRKAGDQSLLDTARRALRESLKVINGYRILGKVPSSVYSFKYPKKIVEMTGFDGAKVFFMKANLDQPDSSVLEAIDAAKNEKLKWLTRDEASKLVKYKYMHSFGRGLLHEDRVDVDKVLHKASVYAHSMNAIKAKISQ